MPELGRSSDAPRGSFGSPPDPLEQYDEASEEAGSDEETDPAGPAGQPAAQDAPENATGSATKDNTEGQAKDGAESGDAGGEAPENEAGEAGGTEVSTESLEAFSDTYRIAETDAGFTPQEILDELREGEGREPGELDEEILDALIVDGYYERSFELGSSSFRLRTTDPNMSHNVVRVLQETLGDDEPVTEAVRGPMLVSQHLSYFHGEQLPGAGPEEAFSSISSIKRRFQRCMQFPTPVLDGIGARINAFRGRVQDATERSMANF